MTRRAELGEPTFIIGYVMKKHFVFVNRVFVAFCWALLLSIPAAPILVGCTNEPALVCTLAGCPPRFFMEREALRSDSEKAIFIEMCRSDNCFSATIDCGSGCGHTAKGVIYEADLVGGAGSPPYCDAYIEQDKLRVRVFYFDDGEQPVQGEPYRLRVEEVGGDVLIDETHLAQYEESYPNGKACDAFSCWSTSAGSILLDESNP